MPIPGARRPRRPYNNTFQCIPVALPFRPERTTPRPASTGPRRPSSSGHPGEEIFTDKYGRVKVQFPWDRQGKNDANSSCWIRVATPWAGKQWGIDPHPPDRPGGRRRLPGRRPRPADHRRQRLQRRRDAPLHPPDNMTQSGYLSRSTLQGDRRQLQPAPLRGQEGLGADQLPRREGLQPRRREQRLAHSRLRQEGQGRPDDRDLQQPHAQRRDRQEPGRRRQPDHHRLQQPDPHRQAMHAASGGSQTDHHLQGPHRRRSRPATNTHHDHRQGQPRASTSTWATTR